MQQRTKGETMKRVTNGMRWLLAALSIVAGMLCRLPAGQAAESDTPGRYLYLKYCSACHGSGGKGDGVASGFMRPKPADLTQLAKHAGGDFPYVPTMQVIDGTKTVRAHGDAEMPVWGEALNGNTTGPMEHRVAVQGRLMLLTDYIRSIQEK